jgi:hypothetical protein
MKIVSGKRHRIREFVLLLLFFISLILYQNRQLVVIYYHYFSYKLNYEDNHYANSHIYTVISLAKEANYNCKNKDLPGSFAYQEIRKRTKGLTRSEVYIISECVQLPPGKIFMSIEHGNTQYYILLKIEKRSPEFYHIIDIRGETLG